MGFRCWTWDFGDGNTSNQPNPSHTYTSVGRYEVSLTILDAEGCQAVISGDSIFVGEQIDRLLTALIPSITNNCTINGFKIANKVNFQRQLRTQAIQMLNAFFQNNTNNPQELLNQLKYQVKGSESDNKNIKNEDIDTFIDINLDKKENIKIKEEIVEYHS